MKQKVKYRKKSIYRSLKERTIASNTLMEGVNVYYIMGFKPSYFTCIVYLYLYYTLYYTLLVPHTYASNIRH